MAVSAGFAELNGITIDIAGNLFITDSCRIRKIATIGIITTVVGNGSPSLYGGDGDGALAISAYINYPKSVAVDANGNVYIQDYERQRIRKTSTTGIIITVAGNSNYGFSGDGRLATATSLINPRCVAVDGLGNFYIVEDYRIRKVTSSTLPLTLLTFTAQQQNNTVNLSWQTTNEVNSSHFTMQRSVDGLTFTAIGNVATKGGGNYGYTDDLSTINNQQPTIYYRLQMVDKDGSFTYSKVVAVPFTIHHSLFTIFPNPVKETLFVQLISSKAEKLILQVTDMQGKVLQQQIEQVGVGNTSTSINTATLAKGSYVLLIKGADMQQQKQFVK